MKPKKGVTPSAPTTIMRAYLSFVSITRCLKPVSEEGSSFEALGLEGPQHPESLQPLDHSSVVLEGGGATHSLCVARV